MLEVFSHHHPVKQRLYLMQIYLAASDGVLKLFVDCMYGELYMNDKKYVDELSTPRRLIIRFTVDYIHQY